MSRPHETPPWITAEPEAEPDSLWKLLGSLLDDRRVTIGLLLAGIILAAVLITDAAGLLERIWP